MNKSDSCNICHKNVWMTLFRSKDRIFDEKKLFTVKRCSHCGLVKLFPQPTKIELKNSYPSQKYYSYNGYKNNTIFLVRKYLIEQSVKENFLSRLLTLIFPLPAIPKMVKNGKLLDIGCGGGQTLKILHDLGWETYGIEIDMAAVKTAKASGLKNITLGSYTKLNTYPDNYFDVIRLYHVIEHLDDPMLCIKLIYKKLKKGGKLYIGTPNIDSLIGKLGGTYWFNLDTPRHLYIFTPRVLSQLLIKNHFVVERIQYGSGGGIIATIQYYLADQLHIHISLLTQHWLLILFYPIDWLLDRLRLGDVYTITVEK